MSGAAKPKRKRPEGRFVCKCKCGGNVRGVKSFGHLWTWCDKCSPVQTISMSKLNQGRGP